MLISVNISVAFMGFFCSLKIEYFHIFYIEITPYFRIFYKKADIF